MPLKACSIILLHAVFFSSDGIFLFIDIKKARLRKFWFVSLGSIHFIPLSFCFWNRICLSSRNFLLNCQATNKELLFSDYKIKGLTVKPSYTTIV